MPNLVKMIRVGNDLSRCAFLFAAYRHYLKYKIDDHGNMYEIAEPWMTSADEKLIYSTDAAHFLHLSPFKKIQLTAVEPFLKLYLRFVDSIKDHGITQALESMLIRRPKQTDHGSETTCPHIAFCHHYVYLLYSGFFNYYL